MYPNVRNKKDCLHCGNETADYCEKCYQDLISENAELQKESKEKSEILDETIIEYESIYNRYDKYIKDLEHIRDCYYKEIAAREQSEILKANNNRKIDLYEKETSELRYDGTMPIIVWINKEEFLRLKELSKTCDNIDYNTDDGIYIE